MVQLIDKSALVAEIDDWRHNIMMGIVTIHLHGHQRADATFEYEILGLVRDFIDTLEVIDPYEQCIQYASIESGIKAHAEDYSFNIESELFNQLTKEQQALWRKEIEQACISGGYSGLNLAKDRRYDDTHEMKEVNLEKEIDIEIETRWRGEYLFTSKFRESAKHFFELGLKAQKGEEV